MKEPKRTHGKGYRILHTILCILVLLYLLSAVMNAAVLRYYLKSNAIPTAINALHLGDTKIPFSSQTVADRIRAEYVTDELIATEDIAEAVNQLQLQTYVAQKAQLYFDMLSDRTDEVVKFSTDDIVNMLENNREALRVGCMIELEDGDISQLRETLDPIINTLNTTLDKTYGSPALRALARYRVSLARILVNLVLMALLLWRWIVVCRHSQTTSSRAVKGMGITLLIPTALTCAVCLVSLVVGIFAKDGTLEMAALIKAVRTPITLYSMAGTLFGAWILVSVKLSNEVVREYEKKAAAKPSKASQRKKSRKAKEAMMQQRKAEAALQNENAEAQIQLNAMTETAQSVKAEPLEVEIVKQEAKPMKKKPAVSEEPIAAETVTKEEKIAEKKAIAKAMSVTMEIVAQSSKPTDKKPSAPAKPAETEVVSKTEETVEKKSSAPAKPAETEAVNKTEETVEKKPSAPAKPAETEAVNKTEETVEKKPSAPAKPAETEAVNKTAKAVDKKPSAPAKPAETKAVNKTAKAVDKKPSAPARPAETKAVNKTAKAVDKKFSTPTTPIDAEAVLKAATAAEAVNKADKVVEKAPANAEKAAPASESTHDELGPICMHCGKRMKGSARFCIYCGKTQIIERMEDGSPLEDFIGDEDADGLFEDIPMIAAEPFKISGRATQKSPAEEMAEQMAEQMDLILKKIQSDKEQGKF